MSATGSFVDSAHPVEDDQLEKDPATLEPLPEQAAEHQVDLWLLDTDLRLSLGLGTRFAWEARIPFRVVGVEATFLDQAGVELPDFESIHHRDEVLAGIGDVELGARVRLLRPSLTDPSLLDLYGGLAFPTGNVEDNPFERGRQGLDHQHIFFGTGTLDPYLGLSFSRTFGPVDLAAWAIGRAALYEGSIGYQTGAKLTSGIALASRFGLDDWYFSLGPEVYHEEPSTWDDGSEAVNSGRTDLSLMGGVFWQASESFQPYLVVKKPFTLRAEGGQFDLPVVLTLGAELTVGLFGASAADDGHGHGHGHDEDNDHDDHGHDDHGHDDHGDEHTADVADAATGGATFSLQDTLVPNKLTVIDFWATWCHPCEHIDTMLRQLAAEHPELAVRRVEVIDGDSPAVVDHLEGADVRLPVVWIHDRQGKRIHELVGTTDEAVRAALEPLLEHEVTAETPRPPPPPAGEHPPPSR